MPEDSILDGVEPRFAAKIREIIAVRQEKGEDYGDDGDTYANIHASAEFGVLPWLAAIVRLNDNVTRIKSFVRKGNLKNDPIEDSFRDIAVYSLIAWIMFEEAGQ